MRDLSTAASEIRFRPIAPADQALLFRVYASTREEELAAVIWEPGQKEAFLRQQFDAQHQWYQQNYAGAEFLVIVSDGVPAGRLYVVRWEKEIRLIDIALLPEHRNGGVGSAILGEILAEGSAAGKPVTIHVEKFNPALRLYLRLGFTPIEDRDVYYLMERAPTPPT
ncbi:MAG TPA: GNAT family N-acetyltransferase [Thermoanaerobaculia bacterium]|jgi:GNAT superfamily N-acetyltransferase|nr:GNAT family N-acetyltransferase [Thermoanaerobaculia bacterium]